MELLETAILKDFLLALFGGHSPIAIYNDFSHLLSQSIRWAGIWLQNSMMAVDSLFAASKDATEILAENLVSSTDSLLEQHQDQVKASRAALRKDQIFLWS